jgi:hypothetical protein
VESVDFELKLENTLKANQHDRRAPIARNDGDGAEDVGGGYKVGTLDLDDDRRALEILGLGWRGCAEKD